MDEFYKDGSDAMLASFEPKTPCRQMETRPCVRITIEDDRRFRVKECLPMQCARFPKRDRKE